MHILYFATIPEFKLQFRIAPDAIIQEMGLNEDAYIVGIIGEDFNARRLDIENWFEENNIVYNRVNGFSIFGFDTFEDALLFKLAWE